MTSTMKTDEDWFDNVENLRPLRGGRRAGTLNEVATGTTKVTVEEAERKFMTEFANAADQEDPLESMYRFTTWFEEHFPSGNQKYFYPLLYKICTTYCVLEAYSNDERLLKLWLKLAENFPESGLAVMEFAFAKGSCRQLAKFYINWSEMYQSVGWWNKAREKIQLGIRMCAMPLDLLHRAADELETSVMRVTCDDHSEDEDDEAFIGDEGMYNARETLGKLRGLGRRLFAPIIRAPQSPPGTLSSKRKQKQPVKDKFEIFTDDIPTSSQHEALFQTPIGTRPGKKSRIMDLLLTSDIDFQTLFGACDTREKTDLQITNEENELKTIGISCSRLPTITAHQTPAHRAFEVFQDPVADEQQQQAKKGGKSRLKLRKEYVKSMSVEEGFAGHVHFNNTATESTK